MTRWLLLRALAVPTILAGSAFAADPVPEILPAATGWRHPPKRIIVLPDCPPPATVVPPGEPMKLPIDPTRPPDKKDPAVEPPVVPPNTDPLAQAPEAGTQAAATLNPNLYGDQFGGSTRSITQLVINKRSLFFVFTGNQFSAPNILLDYTRRGNNLLGPLDTQSSTLIISDNGRSITIPSPLVPTSTSLNANPPLVALLESAPVTSALQSLNPGASVLFFAPGSVGTRSQSGIPTAYNINQAYDIITASSSIRALAVVPSPTAGGVVGRTKLSDDNSPMPRDRIILGGDYFDGAALTPGGINVTRFSPGIEYTFLDRLASIEARFPFASTLDPTVGLNGTTNRATEFGNVNLTFKGLLLRGQEFNVAAGLGLSLPTGPDTIVRTPTGGEFLKITNDSWIVTPYVAAQWTPGDRFFTQAWAALGVDPVGSRVFVGGTQYGRIYDQTLLSLDAQLGYWIIRNDSSDMLRGLAPFAELHYNTSLSDASTIQAGGLAVAASNNRFDEWNLTVGATAQIGTNLLVSAGLVMPLSDGANKFFDYQFGLRASWFFGPTAQARELADATGGRVEPVGTPPGANPPDAGLDVAAPGGDLLAQAPEAGTQAAASLNPGFFGDFIGLSTRVQSGRGVLSVPVAPRYNGFKISDADGPRPSDRVSYSFYRYSDVNGAVNPAGSPELSLTRHVLGLESTVGSNASLGVRLPFLSTGGIASVESHEVGDLTFIGKYAVYNDCESGDVCTVGLNFTLPTGGRGSAGAPRSVFVQPWLGTSLTSDRTFVQGMTAVLLPAEPIYPTALFTSVGAGYWLYKNDRDTLIRGIAPVVEVHANIPLTQRADSATVFFRDQVNLTTGVNLQFPRLSCGAALCVPLVGPKPYGVEGMFSVNYQF